MHNAEMKHKLHPKWRRAGYTLAFKHAVEAAVSKCRKENLIKVKESTVCTIH